MAADVGDLVSRSAMGDCRSTASKPSSGGRATLAEPFRRRARKDGLGTRPASLQKSYEMKPETRVAKVTKA